ncbi:MAG: nitrate reductase molybdenum cofactor assembly chaperone [Gammaproteobacteria bacterium]|nr:nitrate reductase molybdenum cofactor assembly chaperone [Gammaproteobacteria bacterium]
MTNNHKSYTALGHLLTYPKHQLITALDEVQRMFQTEKILSQSSVQTLIPLIDTLKQGELLGLQEQYVALFDSQPLLSLYLFEHRYGDSRDRGQAMVDLIAQYQQAGLKINEGELPDYLPLFLEYLSTLSNKRAKQMLGEQVNIIAVLARRLQSHNSPYAKVFMVLESLSSVAPDKKVIKTEMQRNDKRRTASNNVEKTWQEPAAFSKDEQPIDFVHNPLFRAKADHLPTEKS